VISTAEQELLAAIIANPDDDAPRLVLADWLSQQGEPRGELIVVACTLTHDDVPIGVRRQLLKRHEALLREHGARWLNELGLKPSEGHFVRGMVEAVEAPAKTLLPRIDQLFACTPVRALRVIDVVEKQLRAIAFSTHLPRLRSLAFENLQSKLTPLLETEGLRSLRALRIGQGRVVDGDLRGLLGASCQLRELRLDRNRISKRGATTLADSPNASTLRVLDLCMNELKDAGARALASSPNLTELTALNLNHNQLTFEGAEAIASTPTMTHLCELDLGFNQLGDRGVTALARSMFLRELESLHLDMTGLTAGGAQVLVASVGWPKLQGLFVAQNRLTPSAEALLQSHFAGRVWF